MGFLKDTWNKAKEYGSKVYTVAKDINSKFGDAITQGANALTKMPHIIPRTIGNVLIGAQKLLGKTKNFDEVISRGKDYVTGKGEEYIKNIANIPNTPEGGNIPTQSGQIHGRGLKLPDMDKVLNGGPIIKRLFG